MTLNTLIDKMNAKKALALTLFFIIMLYLIDFSIIGMAELSRITNGGKILDMEKTGYSVEKAYDILTQLGEIGRNFYLTKIIPLDIIFPISMMMMNFSWLSLFLKKCTKKGNLLRYLAILPLIDMTLDWTENACFFMMLKNFPQRLESLCKFSSIVTQVKFASVGIIFLADFILIASVIFIKMRNRKQVSKIDNN